MKKMDIGPQFRWNNNVAIGAPYNDRNTLYGGNDNSGHVREII